MCLWLCLCTLKFLLVSRQHFETEKSEVPNLLRRKARFLIFEKATLKFHLLLRLVIVETYLLTAKDQLPQKILQLKFYCIFVGEPSEEA